MNINLILDLCDDKIPEAQFIFAVLLENELVVESSFKEALKIYEELASKEYPPAQFRMAKYFLNLSSEKHDNNKGFYWMLKAAENGFLPAMFLASANYEYGIGTEIDEKKALYWSLKAAEKGYLKAIIAVANSYKEGVGTDSNLDKEMFYLERAVKLGDGDCAYRIGAYYFLGEKIKRDIEVALGWFGKASDLGCWAASKELHDMFENGKYGRDIDLEKSNFYRERRGRQYQEALEEISDLKKLHSIKEKNCRN